MKKILWAAVLAGCMMCSAACGQAKESGSVSVLYTVTFVQTGQPDAVRTVKAGETLTDIPAVKETVGYTVSWEDADFNNISSDMTVRAVEIPNSYTVTYDTNGGTMSATMETFVYDAHYTLPTPVRENYSFVCWTNGGESVTSEGIWRRAENVTLTALWREVLPETYTVTFIQEGQPNIEKTVKRGETLTDIPSPAAVPGYEVVWNRTDFSSLHENLTVSALMIPKTYLIVYDLGELKNHEDVEISAPTQTVTYGQAYRLSQPSCQGYKFLGWVIAGTDRKVETGVYEWTEDLHLTALWQWEEGWTSFY